MERRKLGRTGIDVPVLCLGTMMYGDQISEADAFEQMDVSLERGVDFFDTAEMYTIPPKPETQGESERIVGAWMKARGVRDKITLATKVIGRSNRLTYIRKEESGLARLTRKAINEAIDGSLRRLQTDYVDLYQIHWPDRASPIFGMELGGYHHYEEDYISFEETLDVLGELQKAGKVKHFGLSNESAWGVMKFMEAAEKTGGPRMASIQNAYSLVNRMFEYALAEVSMNENIGLLAYSPLAQGILSGKYRDGTSPDGSRGALFPGMFGRYKTPNAEEAINAYVDLALKYGLDPSQFAFQFVNTRPFVTSNIFGASTREQLDLALGSVDLEWTDELEAAVNALHAKYVSPCP